MVRGREELYDGGNRGFTLVELIVALVILSILAAVVVPGLLSYIDDYKEKELLTRAQTALAAAQAEVTTCYNRAAGNQNIEEMLGETDDEGITRLEKIARAANMPGGSEAGFNMKAAPAIATPKNRDAGTVYCFVYKEGKKQQYTTGNRMKPAESRLTEQRRAGR